MSNDKGERRATYKDTEKGQKRLLWAVRSSAKLDGGVSRLRQKELTKALTLIFR